MNVQLLLAVKNHILKEPKRLNMSSWIQNSILGSTVECSYEQGIGRRVYGLIEVTHKIHPECNTVCCSSGLDLACPSSSPLPINGYSAAEHLGLPETVNLAELFYPEDWPSAYFNAYLNAKSPGKRAKITGEVIDLFIEKYEGVK